MAWRTGRSLRLVCLSVCLAASAEAADAVRPSAAAVLGRVGFDAQEQQRVLSGEFVTKPLSSTTPRDLAVAISFLMPESPAQLDREVLEQALVVREDPNTLARGELTGEGSPADLAGLSLSPAERELYRTATAGQSVNLSSAELDSLKAAGGASAVDQQLQQILLARYRSYRAHGLAGIPGYARGAGQTTDAAAELKRMSEAAQGVATFDPPFYRLLLGYPELQLPGLEEVFRWTHYEAHGEPTLILTHDFSAPVSDAILFVQRQFYVSRGYNVEQAIAGFLPAKEGTLVVYTNHTSTDQVVGLGGSARRSLGKRLMAAELEALFEKIRRSAGQP